MVAVLRVGNLQAGLPLRLLAVGRVRLDGTRRTFLEEVRHEAHLPRRSGAEKREELAARNMKAEQEEVKKKGAGVGKMCMSERAQLSNDTCNTSEGGTHRVQVKTPAGHKTLLPRRVCNCTQRCKGQGRSPTSQLLTHECNVRTHALSTLQC